MHAKRGRKPKNQIVINHYEGIDINSKAYADAHNELIGRIFPGALIISPKQARNLKNLVKLNDVQFEILYNEYVNQQLTINESRPPPAPNYAAQSITRNGNDMEYEINNFVRQRIDYPLLSIEQFQNVIRNWKTNN